MIILQACALLLCRQAYICRPLLVLQGGRIWIHTNDVHTAVSPVACGAQPASSHSIIRAFIASFC